MTSKPVSFLFRLSILLIIWAFFILPLTDAQTRIDVGQTNPPQNLVLLIFDGLGSKYISPGSIPQALDGTRIRPAEVPVLHDIISNGVLMPDVRVPVPKTGPAHSVIITGYSGADQEMVEYPYATVYDILEDEGFLSIAIMHKGDFTGLRSEQDIILYSESNSIINPSFLIQVNDDHVSADIKRELEYWVQRLPSYIEGTEGIDSYIAYGYWELNASKDIVSLMAQQHPDIRYILTINVGVVDSAGHYRGAEGYIDSIERLGNSLGPLYKAARDSNTALVITADHGMAFKSADAPRGGHASEEYYSSEAVTVPLIIISPNVVPGVLEEEYTQEDVAPTLLSILDIPGRPKYADGKPIPVKEYANLWVSSDTRADVEIFQGPDRISSGTGDTLYIFSGLKPKINYVIKISNGDNILEQAVNLDADRLVRFKTAITTSDKKDGNEVWRKRIATVLIFLVIAGGLLVISRIKD